MTSLEPKSNLSLAGKNFLASNKMKLSFKVQVWELNNLSYPMSPHCLLLIPRADKSP